jgi:hypothetical protein
VTGITVVVVWFSASTIETHRRVLLRASYGRFGTDATAWRSAVVDSAQAVPAERAEVVEVRQSV